MRSPGVVIVDSQRQVVWSHHEGVRIGDSPDHAVILRALEDLAAA